MGEVGSSDSTTGPYRLIRVVGSGGMGVVHEAWDARLDRRVALKMLHPHLLASPELSARFEREAKKAARIEHPNVVRVYRVDRYDGRMVIEMQFVDGTPLSTLLRSGPLSLGQAADVLRQTLEALQACHDQGVIHCDLKPGNLLVTRDGHVMLTDFGVARALYEGGGPDSGADPLTWSGPVWGTPLYSAPECWDGATVTPQRDLYAAGALTYEATAGTPPFTGQTPLALMKAVLMQTPPPLRSERPEVSEVFSGLVECLMARQPDARPKSARAALELLSRTPEVGTAGPETAPLPRVPSPLRPNDTGPVAAPSRARLGAAMLLAVLVLVVVIAAFAHGRRPSAAPVAPAARSTAAPRFQKHDPKAAEQMVLGDTAFFVADDGRRGRELWYRSSTTPEPLMVTDIVPGSGSSNPRRLMKRPLGGFVFTATTPETGEELWYGTTDVGGAPPKVRMIKDIIPGPMGSDPEPVGAEGALVLFYATTLAAGRELWCTNTATGQTAMVGDLIPGQMGSAPMKSNSTSVTGGAYLLGYASGRGLSLLRYDYVANSLREISDVGSDTGAMAMAGNKLLFASTDPEHGYEVWNYDENTDTCGLLADRWPGAKGSDPGGFFTFGDRVLFQARTAETGLELWISDGTAAGTRLLADINPGPHDSDPYGFVPAGKQVFFRAKDDACGQELWVTDGTQEGTSRVADVTPGLGSGNPYNLVVYADSLFFTADDGAHGEELWRATHSEGKWTAALATDLYPGPTGSEPHQLQWASEIHGYFLAKTPDAGETLCLLHVEPPESRRPGQTDIKVYDITAKQGGS